MLSEIAATAEARIQQVLADYREKKRGRTAGWSAKFTKDFKREWVPVLGLEDNFHGRFGFRER